MRSIACAMVTLLLVVATSVAQAQTTTGRLIGVVSDDTEAPLPRVKVTISSPALIGGAQTRVTGGDGGFSFISIAPGMYVAEAELAGFITQERNEVKVPLGGAAAVHITMPRASFSGEIDVLAVTPVVDPTQVNTGQIFDRSYMQSSAIGSGNRSYNTVVNQTAGVVGGGEWAGVSQPRVLGSTIGENAYFIDGMDTTNPVMATATAVLNFDAIGEIQLQTGGFEAEYGRATGGIVNLVTRSGGNQLSGTVDARYRDASFQESGDHFEDDLTTRHGVLGATLGGPILRDRVWFFTSYGWINDVFTPIGSPTTRDQEGQNYLAKITWQIDPGWRLSAKYTTDPTTWDNYDADRVRMPGATRMKKGTTAVLSTELAAVLSDSLLWSTSLGTYDYESNVFPQTGDLAAISHYNYSTDLWSANHQNQQYWDTNRTDLATDLTWFVDGLAGSHEFKGGIEYSDLSFNRSNCTTGTPNGERCVPNGVGFSFRDIEAEGTLPVYMYERYTSGPSDYSGSVATLFAQDAWRPVRDLTLKLGLRYDTVTYDTNTGTQIADLATLQPRLGAAWDLTGDGRSILRGSWGRFMHPNMLTLPSRVRDLVEPSYRWYSCSGYVPGVLEVPVASPDECEAVAANRGWEYRLDNEGWDPYGWVLSPDEIYASEPNQAAADLSATYADQLILAFERQVGSQSSVELSFVDKGTRGIIDDTCNGNWPTPGADPSCDSYVLGNIQGLERDYQGVTLKYETRSFSWLTLLASYTYSSSRGSIEYSQGGEIEVDRYPWQYENIYGYLSDHRRHRLKLNGFFYVKGDWAIAFDGHWASPFTWAPLEDANDNPEMPSGLHLLEPRGSREANSNYQLDLQVSKGFTAGRVRFVLIATALNALGSEQPTEVCWSVSGCTGIGMGEPIDWQTPRRYEVGFRVEF